MQHEASLCLSQEEPDGALEALARIATSQPETAAKSEVDVVMDGQTVGQVFIDARRRAISVLLHNDFLEKHALRAVAEVHVQQQSREENASRYEAELQAAAGSSYHLAEFEQLPDGVLDCTVRLYTITGP